SSLDCKTPGGAAFDDRRDTTVQAWITIKQLPHGGAVVISQFGQHRFLRSGWRGGGRRSRDNRLLADREHQRRRDKGQYRGGDERSRIAALTAVGAGAACSAGLSQGRRAWRSCPRGSCACSPRRSAA